MAAGDVKLVTPASSDLTITLASLATSSTFIAGRQSTAVDNSTNLYLDYLLAGVVTVGTTPTANTEIRVYVVALRNDSTWPDGVGATDAAWSTTTAGKGSGYLKLAAVMLCDATTSNVGYSFGPVSVAALFGGVVPDKFAVIVTHSTAVNLNSTAGNHVISITPQYPNQAQS